MATLDFRVKNGLVTGANTTSLGTAVYVLIGGNVGVGDSNPGYKLAVSGTLNATGAITQAGNQVLHASNYNSYAPTLTGTGASGTWGISITGDAGTVDGFSASTTQAVSTIVARDSNGYAFFNYINSNTVNGENPTISQVIVTNGTDGYYRKSTIASLTSAVQTNASGNWAINSYNITQYPLNQSVTTTSAPTFAGITSTAAVSVSSGAAQPLALTTSSSTPWSVSLTRSDTATSSRVKNDNGSRWYFEHRPSFAGNDPLDAGNYNSYSPTLTGTGASGTWGISISGSAATLTTARTINGTSFNGSAAITTASWGTARTVTIGSTGKSVDGSGNISWTLTEIGVPSSTGTGASGTWGISISGTAATATNQSGGTISATTGSFSGAIGRSTTTGGFLQGNYSSVETGQTPGVIYTIGGASYLPTATTLGTMYGIGYGLKGGTAIGTVGGSATSAWGLYGASNGVARWFLDTDNGSGWFNANLYVNGGYQVVYNSGNWAINASNITSYTINQNVGTANSPTFAGLTLTSNLTVASGDIYCYRTGGTTGVIFLNSAGNRYLYYNGSVYEMPGAELNVNGSRVLNAGNYNSYVPSLTGSNASGTWGISITGSAASATGSAATFTSTTQNSQFNSIGIGTPASTTAGEIRATNNITAYYSSDASLKQNVKNIENPIGKINSINGVEFDWTDEYINEHGGEDGYFVRRHDVGVIAQEIEKVLPEVVATREDGIKAVKYDRIVPLLIEAIKQLSNEVEELKRGK